MSTRLGPFQFVYAQREQKMRDTIAHLVKKHGLIKARAVVGEEARRCAWRYDLQDPRTQWWADMMWTLKRLAHALNYGAKVGL